MTEDLEAKLSRCLTDMFQAKELYCTVRDHVGRDLGHELPPHAGESRKGYAGRMAEWLLDRRLLTKEFFAALHKARPERGDEIVALENQATQQLQNATAVDEHEEPVRRARAHYLEAIVAAEEDRQTLDAIFTSVSAAGAVVSLREVYIPPQLIQSSLSATTVSMEVRSGDAPSREDRQDDAQLFPASLTRWLIAVDEEHALLIVAGEMGSGKTELLHCTRHELARTAMEDHQAPLPILIKARDLAADAKMPELAAAASKQLAMQVGNLEILLRDESTRWVYLIDGLDEADPATWRSVRALARTTQCRATRVVATTRPSPPPGVKQTVLLLSPWNASERERFLERWQAFDADAVRVLRESPQYQGSRDDLMANPLTATLALAVASRGGALPHSRAVLFGEIVDILSQEWARTRDPQSLRWADVASALQEVALQYLQERRSHVPRELLHDALERLAPDRALEMERDTERRFGVLVRLDGGHGYDFLLRGIAEYLAGQALLERGIDAIPDASQEAWAEEPVRHAVGLAEKRDSLVILGRLLQDGRPGPEPAEEWLRPLLSAIRACADRRTLPPKVTKVLVKAICIALFDEESSWVGDRVADAVRVLAASGSSLTKALWQVCYQHLTNPIAQPVTWYMSQRDRSAEWWRHALRHRDAKVRAVACRRLASHVDDPEVREDLVFMLLDEGFVPPPALIAGQALRGATRNSHFASIQETLLELLKEGGQFSAGGAALALLPDEADPRALARALSMADEGCRMIAAPLRELADAPGGREALDAVWPDWPERQDEEWSMMPFPAPSTTGEDPGRRPASRHVRRRILRAFALGLHHLDTEQVREALDHAGDAVNDDLCRALYHRPDEFLPLLRLGERTNGIFYLETQRELGRAALKHPQVRDALLDAWDTHPDAKRVIMSYPGAALEPLVCRRDERAVEVYASWLEVSNYMLPGEETPHPDPAVFDVPEVAEAARTRVRNAWEYATRGRDQDGQRSYLAPQTVRNILGHFWPVWIHDVQLVDEVLQWLEGDETGKVTAALWALTRGPLPDDTRRRVESVLLARLDRCRDPSALGFNEEFHAARWLRSAEFFDFPDARPVLRTLAAQGSEFSALAAAILLPSLATEDERHQLAITVAETGVLPFGEFLLERHRRELIQAAPGAWFRTVEERIRSSQGWSHQVVLRLLPVFPDEQRRRLAVLVREELEDEDIELPWLRMASWMGPTVYARPADALSQIFFDAGLPIPPMDSDVEPDADADARP